VIRGVALCGGLLANQVFALRVSPTAWYLPDDPYTPFLDRAVESALVFVVQGKAIALFSMLFGVGLAIQHERFARAGDPRYWLLRRLLVLPLLGAPTRTLAHAALACLLLYLVFGWLPFAPQWPDLDTLKREHFEAIRIYGSGTFAEIRRYSWHEFRVFMPIYVGLFPLTPAYLLLGVLAWRSGALRDPAAHRAMLKTLALGGVLIGAALTTVAWKPTEISYFSGGLAAPVMAVGYGAALLLALQSAPWAYFLHAFAAAGRMAFTNYLMQSLVLGWVFWGYGLGLMGKMGAARGLAWAIAFFVLQAAASAWWLRRFRFGPVEWLWRTLAYARPQPMLRG
jgi:uncharacterized protein